MFSLLDRVIAREVAALTVIYSVGFLALIGIAVSVPLIRGGAPLWDVLLFIPNQLAFPATLVIPLALLTGMLSTIARLREDGELVALKAAGISALRLASATLPLALVATCTVAFLAHVVMPEAYRNFWNGKAGLLRQAMATQVARKEPFHQTTAPGEQLTLTAIGASGNELSHVFAWRISTDGQLWVGYAPVARWSVHDDKIVPGTTQENALLSTLQLDLRDGRFMRFPLNATESGSGTLPYPHWIGNIPQWSVSIEQETRGAEHRAEGKSTAQLADEIKTVHAEIMASAHSSERHQNWVRRRLRDLQLAYHSRYLLTFGLIAWWLFALGLGLSMPSRNRLAVIGIGLGLIILTVVPGFALVKGMRGHLPINPSLLLYVPALSLAAAGGWLLYRQR